MHAAGRHGTIAGGMTRPARMVRIAAASSLLLVVAGGCQALGVIADKIPKPPVKAEHALAGSTVGVMVWADRGVRIDWPRLPLDLAGGIQSRLEQAAKTGKKQPDLVGATFPVQPASIVRWQRDHPGHEAEQITDVAPRLGVQKLIYVELARFSTRAAGSTSLYRGTAVAQVKVVEVKDGRATIVYEAGDVTATFPKRGTDEGTPSGSDQQFYVGTVQALADQVAKRFVEHPAPEDGE